MNYKHHYLSIVLFETRSTLIIPSLFLHAASARITSAAFSETIYRPRTGNVPMILGKIDMSTTLSPSTPRTRKSPSSTARGSPSTPMGHYNNIVSQPFIHSFILLCEYVTNILAGCKSHTEGPFHPHKHR